MITETQAASICGVGVEVIQRWAIDGVLDISGAINGGPAFNRSEVLRLSAAYAETREALRNGWATAQDEAWRCPS